LNNNLHYAARLTYPVKINNQIIEASIQGYTGDYVLTSSTLSTNVKRVKDLNYKELKLNFNEKVINYGEVENNSKNKLGVKISDAFYKWWEKTPKGKSLSFAHPKGSFFNSVRISDKQTIGTITATNGAKIIHHTYPNEISNECIQMCGTYPLDYNFKNIEPKYLIGMSVPPVMTAQIAYQIYLQWFRTTK
jgi:DNA (cytosine-5)-methyltransferase 1